VNIQAVDDNEKPVIICASVSQQLNSFTLNLAEARAELVPNECLLVDSVDQWQ
jgi:hypothetical protein